MLVNYEIMLPQAYVKILWTYLDCDPKAAADALSF